MKNLETLSAYIRHLERRVNQLERTTEIQNVVLREMWDSMQYNQRLAIEKERREHPAFPTPEHRDWWNPFPGKQGE